MTRWKKYWLYGDKVQEEGQVSAHLSLCLILLLMLLLFMVTT